MLDLFFLLLQAVWVAFGGTCLVLFVVLLRAGAQGDARAPKQHRSLTQFNAAQARHA